MSIALTTAVTEVCVALCTSHVVTSLRSLNMNLETENKHMEMGGLVVLA